LAAALAEGNSTDEAKDIAHKAAKAHWNAWADSMLDQRKELKASHLWAVEKVSLKPENDKTREWMKEAEADFSWCRFLVTGAATEAEMGGCKSH
jgi:hypothetical protein